MKLIYRQRGNFVRTIVLLVGFSFTSFNSFAMDLSTAISKCRKGLVNLWVVYEHAVYYGPTRLRNPVYKAMRKSEVVEGDSVALKMYEVSKSGGPDFVRETGVFEFFGSSNQAFPSSEIFAGSSKFFIPAQTFWNELEKSLQNVPAAEIEVLRFRHTHTRTFINPGDEFSHGDLDYFIKVVQRLKTDGRFRNLKSVEFEIVFRDKAHKIWRRYFSYSVR